MSGEQQSNRAQIWSLDLVFATLAFLTVLLIVFSTNTLVDEQIAVKENSFYMESVAQSVAQNLVGTSGHWYLQSGNFDSVGLALRPNVLDSARVGALFSADYNETKRGLGTGKWELRVRLYNSAGLLGTFGAAPPADSEIKLADRLCVYNSGPALLRVEVWE